MLLRFLCVLKCCGVVVLFVLLFVVCIFVLFVEVV